MKPKCTMSASLSATCIHLVYQTYFIHKYVLQIVNGVVKVCEELSSLLLHFEQDRRSGNVQLLSDFANELNLLRYTQVRVLKRIKLPETDPTAPYQLSCCP